jgi:hypothetical protein
MQSNIGGGDAEGVWEHDRYEDEEEEEEEIIEAPSGGRGGRGGAGLETGSKLLITGLAFSVNDDDIKVFNLFINYYFIILLYHLFVINLRCLL